MRCIVTLFLALISLPLFATNPSTGPSVHIALGTTNLATTYSTSYPQLAITAPRDGYKHAYVFNGCASAIAMTFTSGLNATGLAPSSSSAFQYYVPPMGSTGQGVVLDIAGGRNVWLRSDGSTCSSNDVIVDLY